MDDMAISKLNHELTSLEAYVDLIRSFDSVGLSPKSLAFVNVLHPKLESKISNESIKENVSKAVTYIWELLKRIATKSKELYTSCLQAAKKVIDKANKLISDLANGGPIDGNAVKVNSTLATWVQNSIKNNKLDSDLSIETRLLELFNKTLPNEALRILETVISKNEEIDVAEAHVAILKKSFGDKAVTLSNGSILTITDGRLEVSSGNETVEAVELVSRTNSEVRKMLDKASELMGKLDSPQINSVRLKAYKLIENMVAEFEAKGEFKFSGIDSDTEIPERIKGFLKTNDLLQIRTSLRLEFNDNGETQENLLYLLNWAKKQRSDLFEPYAVNAFAREIDEDVANWDSSYYDRQIVYIKTNFSEKRFVHLIEVREKLRKAEVEGFKAKPRKEKIPTDKVTQLKGMFDDLVGNKSNLRLIQILLSILNAKVNICDLEINSAVKSEET